MPDNYTPNSADRDLDYAGHSVGTVQYPVAAPDDLKTVIYSYLGYTYICQSYPGAVITNAVWRIQRIDSSGNVIHAGSAAGQGNSGKFDQVATTQVIVSALGYY